MNKNKSTFVTVLGWILIVFLGFMVLISILQIILTQIIIPDNEMIKPNTPNNLLNYIFRNFKLVVVASGFIITYFFISSIAFLKRKNWGRVSIIIFFVLSILYLVFGLYYQFIFFGENDLHKGEQFLKVIQMAITIIYVFIILLFVWLIKKLFSNNVIAEFCN